MPELRQTFFSTRSRTVLALCVLQDGLWNFGVRFKPAKSIIGKQHKASSQRVTSTDARQWSKPPTFGVDFIEDAIKGMSPAWPDGVFPISWARAPASMRSRSQSEARPDGGSQLHDLDAIGYRPRTDRRIRSESCVL